MSWITRWQNKAADEAANWAMDDEASFHWVSQEGVKQGEVILAYADGGCRAESSAPIGQGASACVLFGFNTGARQARLLLVSARYWQRASAPMAEVWAAEMAARAVLGASAGRAWAEPVFATATPNRDVAELVSQIQQNYFYQGVSTEGSFI